MRFLNFAIKWTHYRNGASSWQIIAGSYPLGIVTPEADDTSIEYHAIPSLPQFPYQTALLPKWRRLLANN
jgi:hypothetical protein